MEHQTVLNLLNEVNDSKFVTRKYCQLSIKWKLRCRK